MKKHFIGFMIWMLLFFFNTAMGQERIMQVKVTMKNNDRMVEWDTTKLLTNDSIPADWTLKATNNLDRNLWVKVQYKDQKGSISNERLLITKGKTTDYSVRRQYLRISDKDSLLLSGDLEFSVLDQDNQLVGGEKSKIFLKMSLKAPSAEIDYKPGLIYKDAVYLAGPSNNGLTKQKILAEYGYDITNPPPGLDPGLRKLADDIMQKSFATISGTGKVAASTGLTLLNNLGNYDVTNIADGIARFLVSRVKEELSVAFFQQFKKTLDEPPASDLQYLFPATYSILRVIDHEIYNWDNYITSLRDAFDKDLANLVFSLETFEARATVLTSFREHTASHVSARVAFYVARGFTNQVSAGQLLDDFVPDEYIVPTEKDRNDSMVVMITHNINQSVKALQLLSYSFRSDEKDQYWIGDGDFRNLLSQHDLFGYYNLLLLLEAKKRDLYYMQEKDPKGKKIYLWEMLNGAAQIRPVVSGFIVKVKDFRTSLTKMEKAVVAATSDSAKAKISYADLYPFIRSTNAILKYSAEAVYKLTPADKRTAMEPTYRTASVLFDVVDKAGELGMDISLKKYSAAIADLTWMLDRMKDLKTKDKDGKEVSIVIKDTLDRITQSLIRYGTFMASVANAKSSEEVKEVIENYALPVGSSRIKRESAFNVSINAYTGLFAGYESIQSVDFWTDSSHLINSYGIAAPVGVAVSWGNRKCTPGWSYSLFLSAIDVGAIASFRFRDDSVASVPTIQLKDILSPGLFFSLGLPKCPLSVNLGAQMGPNLRTVNKKAEDSSGQNDYANKMYWRISLSVVVDIPIFTLTNRLDRRK